MRISDLSKPDFRTNAEANAPVIAAVENGLSAFNDAVRPDPRAQPLTLAAHDGDGNLIGGLLGRTAYGWLRVDRLWVDEGARGRGIGARLLRQAEHVAARRGCHGAHLDTHSFQAPAFYEAQGYRCFARLPHYPDPDAHCYYAKSLRPATERETADRSRHEICSDITPAEADELQARLIEFSDRFTPPRNYRELGFCIRGPAGEVIGGITASTVWDWLQIGTLWVSEAIRGRGYGHELLTAAEVRGRELGCRHARLSTFEFEARAFYEAHGYRVYSRIDDFPAGHTQFHLRKPLVGRPAGRT